MNKDKIIKDLKERNNKLENQRRQFELNYYHEQHIVEEKDKEIERLNNIINELEKWVKSEYDRYYNDKENIVFSNVEVIDFGRVLDKLKELKELKGSDK